MNLLILTFVVCAVVPSPIFARDAKDLKNDTDTAKSIPAKKLTEELSDREGRGLKDSLSGISAALKGFNQLNSIMGAVNMTEIGDSSTRVAKELSKSLKVDVFAVGKALAGAGAAVGTTVFLGGMAALLATGLGFFNYSPKLYDTGYPFTYQNRVGAYPGVFGQAQQAVYQRVQQAQQSFNPAQAIYSGVPISQTKGVQQQQQQQHQQRPIIGPLPEQSKTATSPQYPVYHGAPHQSGRSADFGEVSARTARVLEEVKQPANPDLMPAIQDLLAKLGEAVNIVGPQVVAAARR